MHPERRTRRQRIKPLGEIAGDIARRLAFNNDGWTPSFLVSDEMTQGYLYHSKPGEENIVVACVALNGENSPRLYLRTFKGPDPIEMDDLDSDEAKRQYELFRQNVKGVLNPEFQVYVRELRTRLKKLADEL